MLRRALLRLVRARPVRRVRYFGLAHWCPFCSSSLRRLHGFGKRSPVFAKANVVGGGYRDNVLCPVCFSSDRERLLFFFLQERTRLFREPSRLLHVAPEGHLRALLKRTSGVAYWCGDLSASAAVDVRLDITRLPFRRASFDAILCSHVLEHVPDDLAAMRELHDLLRPGGWAVIQVPIAFALTHTYEDAAVRTPEQREQEFGQEDHVRLYAMDFVGRLQQAGFRVRPEFLARERGPAWAERFRVNPEEPVFFCERPAGPAAP